MSCDAADVIIAPADRIAGCMRGASDSKLNGEFGEGKLKELVVTAASICSTDDCMMLMRAFNSANASCDALPWRVLSIYLTPTVSTRGTYLAAEGWAVDAAG